MSTVDTFSCTVEFLTLVAFATADALKSTPLTSNDDFGTFETTRVNRVLLTVRGASPIAMVLANLLAAAYRPLIKF